MYATTQPQSLLRTLAITLSGESGIKLHLAQGVSALQGKTAVEEVLLNQGDPIRGFYNGAATKIGRWFIGGTGFTEEQARRRFAVRTGYAGFTTAFPIMPAAKKSRVKLIVDEATGFVVGGRFSAANRSVTRSIRSP